MDRLKDTGEKKGAFEMNTEIISDCCGWSMINDFCNKCNDHCSALSKEELKKLEKVK